MRALLLSCTFLVVVVSAIGCGSGGSDRAGSSQESQGAVQLPQGVEQVKLDPGDFTTRIDNPYWPMRPGSRWVYIEKDGKGERQRIEVTVTNRLKTVDGIKARVVRDVVTGKGGLVEDTYDWYAQDVKGNVWYLGEDTKEFESGKVTSRAGSWEAGVDGAQAGVIVPTHPRAGMSYRQEYYAGEAEDRARVLSVDERVQTPFGSFTGVMMTKDYTPLEPQLLEYKFYAKGVGPVLTLTVAGGADRGELVEFSKK